MVQIFFQKVGLKDPNTKYYKSALNPLKPCISAFYYFFIFKDEIL